MSAHVASLIHELDDLGLAALLCLTATQHCIIQTDRVGIDSAALRLRETCQTSFGLSCAVTDCSKKLSLDEYREGVLAGSKDDPDEITGFDGSKGQLECTDGLSYKNDRAVANVVIMKHMDHAEAEIQSQTIDLIRFGRISTGPEMDRAPQIFLVVVLNSISQDFRMNKQLNDLFSICHVHQDIPSERSIRRKGSFDSIRSTSSTATRSLISRRDPLTSTDIEAVRSSLVNIRMTAEVETYMRNLVVAARMYKFVAGGISAGATVQLGTICRALSLLHGIDYVPPALVDMAFRKTYFHRLVLADRRTARSLQWGSEPDAIEKEMAGVTAEVALDAVIASVDTPL